MPLCPKPFLLERVDDVVTHSVLSDVVVYKATRVVVFDVDLDYGSLSVLDIIEAPTPAKALAILIEKVDYDELCVRQPNAGHSNNHLYTLVPSRKSRRSQAKELYGLWLRFNPKWDIPLYGYPVVSPHPAPSWAKK